jgi:hypothetical protein
MARAARALNTPAAPCADGPPAVRAPVTPPARRHDPGPRRGRLLGDPWSADDRWAGRLRTRDRSA